MSDDINKPWIKATLKEINNIINNQTFLIEDQNEGEHVPTCMDAHNTKLQFDRSIDKLN